jgi:hypothetical protein
MTRDWLLTLLAISWPFLLGATIVALALIGSLTQNARGRRRSNSSRPRGGASQVDDVSPTTSVGADAR